MARENLDWISLKLDTLILTKFKLSDFQTSFWSFVVIIIATLRTD